MSPRLVLLVAVATLVGGCGATPTPGKALAQAACVTYAGTNRHQTASAVIAIKLLRAHALSDADQATSRSTGWEQLGRHISAAYQHLDASALAHNSGRTAEAASQIQAYFHSDSSVVQDCRKAGHDIGPLRP
jgi:hypothetical protein